MTQPQATEPALPRTLILGYVAGAGSPTRVRTVAAAVTLIAGVASMVATLSIIAWIAYDTYEIAHVRLLFFVGPPGAAPSPGLTLAIYKYAIREALISNLPLVLTFPVHGAGSALLPILAPAIRRGRQAASKLVLIWFSITTVAMLWATLIVGIIALGSAGIAFPGPHNRAYLWLLLLVPVGVILSLLMKDTCTFLLWIIRYPAAEKPPVPFWSAPLGALTPNGREAQ